MATKQYIVLRSQNTQVPAAATPRVVPSSLEPEPARLEIAEAELTPAERDDLRLDPRTRAIAEPMPMKLIEPVERQNVPAQPAANDTWGVGAVGANQSSITGTGITVAVLDTGIDPNHLAFDDVDLVRRNFTAESDDDEN